MPLTPAQIQAVRARGDVLVVAGAGTGKTRTLVERCLDCLLQEQPRASLEEIMMVTFTEAAAAEMRQRIRERLQEAAQSYPADPHWPEQLALFDTVHIGTLHSFCFNLVREHFYELELDPQLAILPDAETRLLAEEELDKLFEHYYGARGTDAEAVRRLVSDYAGGRDPAIRSLILRLHHYSQSLPDPEGWTAQQLALFAAPGPETWLQWLHEGLLSWAGNWLPFLREQDATGNDLARQCVAAMEALNLALPVPDWRAQAAAALGPLRNLKNECPQRKRKAWLAPLKKFTTEAEFLFSLVLTGEEGSCPGGPALSASKDPLEQDWNYAVQPMATLLKLAGEFSRAFKETKRELGVVDFHDLEQYALQLLWDRQSRLPTPVSQQWRQKLRFVFVDEYQDINAAQDKIIAALSRDGAQANRFLVGDVKQSIYRFRLANPQIFQRYVQQWSSPPAHAIPLVDNFRSREGILDVVNSVFGLLMRPEMGGIAYDEQARLQFAAPGERSDLSRAAAAKPPAELHFRLKSESSSEVNQDEDVAPFLAELLDLQEAEKEARLIGLRLRELKASEYPVWDERAKGFRPLQWGDVAILLRAPAHKGESYAKEFSRLDIPLQVARPGFYQNLEISDLLNLLHLLDNPLQDLPALAVLHSPLVGLTLNELAAIRLALPKGYYWNALLRWHEAHRPHSGARPSQGAASTDTLAKVSTFLTRYAHWRRLARQASLSRCLETVLAETYYAAWLQTQDRGEQRYANVRRLLVLAQQFDQFQRQGLFRFLRFIEAQQQTETEPEVAAGSEQDAVRLMSIHQSKGLEFPLVVVADLGKPFNFSDLHREIILDEQYGLCPCIKPPQAKVSYPSLPYWLACRRQTAELLGEELRLLYVAMTRARDLLLLSATVPEKKLDKLCREPDPPASSGSQPLDPSDLLPARSCADWLMLWFADLVRPIGPDARAGRHPLFHWFIHAESRLVQPTSPSTPTAPVLSQTAVEPVLEHELYQRLAWQYPFSAATRQPAKTSVSSLRRSGEEAAEVFQFFVPQARSKARSASSLGSAPPKPGQIDPAELGELHHRFLQWVALEHTASLEDLRLEARRLEHAGVLTGEQVELLDFPSLAAFWQSELGCKVREQRQRVRRELPFTARLPAAEAALLAGKAPDASLTGEFVVVQGVADLVVILPEELWLLDYKTDRIKPGEISERLKLYEPQLKLYARVLSQVYRRHVTQCWLYFLMAQRSVELKFEYETHFRHRPH